MAFRKAEGEGDFDGHGVDDDAEGAA